MTLKIPRFHNNGKFTTDLLRRYQRSEQSLLLSV
nr:hypothetical protein [Caldicellulosiruptor changbaiensis]